MCSGALATHLIAVQRASRGAPRSDALRRWASAALAQRRAPVALCLRIVDAAEARALNRRFRGRRYAPNVLSFPAGATLAGPLRPLGDIVLCAPVINAEAQAQHKPRPAHWAHMVVHGVLHLCGLDHDSAAAAARMERREIRILGEFGYSDPYLTADEQ
ncbi:MAG: rRNA maturation RNase YbeY [Gammaproteobacteria bacterium]|nr:rRNA maturation RNase YbeY [Gammaproteobacteria bacterium]